jgi:hypothetical protein
MLGLHARGCWLQWQAIGDELPSERRARERQEPKFESVEDPVRVGARDALAPSRMMVFGGVVRTQMLPFMVGYM